MISILGGWRKFGAGDGIQTRDLCLGKAALYQLSYSRDHEKTKFICEISQFPN